MFWTAESEKRDFELISFVSGSHPKEAACVHRHSSFSWQVLSLRFLYRRSLWTSRRAEKSFSRLSYRRSAVEICGQPSKNTNRVSGRKSTFGVVSVLYYSCVLQCGWSRLKIASLIYMCVLASFTPGAERAL